MGKKVGSPPIWPSQNTVESVEPFDGSVRGCQKTWNSLSKQKDWASRVNEEHFSKSPDDK